MRPILTASLVVFLEMICLGAMFPTMADYIGQFGGKPWMVGLMFALYAVPRVFMNTMWGNLSDRWGRRKVMAISTVGTLAGSILWAYAPLATSKVDMGILGDGLFWIAMSRVIAGLFQNQATITQAMMADSVKPEKLSGAMGLLGVAFGLGMLGGFQLVAWIGRMQLDLSFIGWISCIAQLLSLGVTLLLMPETLPPEKRRKALSDTGNPQIGDQGPSRGLFSIPVVASLLLVGLVFTSGHLILIPTLRSLTFDWYQFTLAQTSNAFSVWMLVGILVQGGAIRPMVKRCGERGTIISGMVLCGAGFFWIALHPGLTGFWAGAILLAIGGSLAEPAMRAMISHQVDSGRQGSVHGLLQSVTALGRLISYLLAAGLYYLSPAAAFAGGGVLVLAAAALMGRVKRNVKTEV